jgi:peroxiredoxin
MPPNKFSTIASIFVILSLFIFSCNLISDDSSKPKEGYFAPDFTLNSIDGREFKLSDLRGKVVFINFWATWCPPCKEEMPSMGQLYKMLKGKEFEILAIATDNDIDAVKKFVKKYNITFPVLVDKEKKVYNLYKATGIPETHLINKLGIIEVSMIGPFNWISSDVTSAVNELLAR